ncbi:MAG TPA: hypothetical protein VNI01_03650 [Elusimicrobiota bacterium]|nr:hypothetical protein [Elusimicrobiota bacterium]
MAWTRRDVEALLAGGALAALLSAPASSAEAPEAGVGGSVSLGSHRYSRVALFGDAQWRLSDFEPYAWAELSRDSYERELAFGGGAWKDLGGGVRAKGGLGAAVGRVDDSEANAASFLAEAALERRLQSGPTLGADYHLTAGDIGGPEAPRVVENTVSGRARGRRTSTTTETQSFTLHELAGYIRLPLGGPTLGLRGGVYFPSYDGRVFSETASLKIPLNERLWLTPSFTLEQATDDDRAYVALSLYYALD